MTCWCLFHLFVISRIFIHLFRVSLFMSIWFTEVHMLLMVFVTITMDFYSRLCTIGIAYILGQAKRIGRVSMLRLCISWVSFSWYIRDY